jgi:hypothetical protein
MIKRLLDALEFYAEEGIETTLVEKSEQKMRIAICENCDNFLSSTRQCKVCMCQMDVKTSLLYDPVESIKQANKQLTVCPKGLW